MATSTEGRGSEPRGRPAATVTTINGKKFVSGLLWQALTQPRSYMKEAKAIGKREGLDIVTIRNTVEVKQAGFVSKADGVYKGMYSLAAALAGQLGDTWIGAFKLPSGQYAVVAVDRGAVVPGADKIGDFDTIKKQLNLLYGRGTTTYTKIYAPEEMSFGGEALDIEELLKPSNLNKSYTLKPLTFGLTTKEWAGSAVGVAVVLALIVLGWQWHLENEHQAKVELALAAQAEADRLADLNKKTRAPQIAPALKHPWSTQSGVADFVMACLTVANSKPLSLAGWPAVSANCKHDLYAVTYARAGAATVNQFIQAAKPLFDLAPAFSAGGDAASLNQPLEMTLAGDEELSDLDTALATFNSHFQQVLIKPEVAEVPYIPPPVPEPLPGADPAQALPPPPLPDWIEFSFKVESHIPPEILIQGLPGRGVRITEVVINREATQLQWTIKGALYAKK
ncbi:type 4b pilus protein PilO2 [Pseudomonas reactans]|uniref:type 4b pilus protein PilO2 n=1 Tax=Pseudomonas reactans TaxID=117680 RepID=UPI0015A4120A|nr:type 4b pilus protein PilO2 [Pseudomonas reactans]NWC89945.1 type 4b pilus protein PilO2 [Pseudomonas reactans]